MYGSSFVSRTHQNIRRDDPRRESQRTKRQNIRRISKMYVPLPWVGFASVFTVFASFYLPLAILQRAPYHWSNGSAALFGLGGLVVFALPAIALFLKLDRYLFNKRQNA
jgi:hypothetical protein